MSRRPPDRKTVLIYLAVGLFIVAVVSILLGTGGIRLARTLVIYGGVFLLLLYVLRRARR